MLDLKFVRSNPDIVIEALQKRGGKISLDNFLKLEEERRSIIAVVEEKKAARNALSKEVGKIKAAGGNADEIMVISDGNIKEKGTHDELMKEDGAYKILYDLQFRDSETHEDEKLASELKITN